MTHCTWPCTLQALASAGTSQCIQQLEDNVTDLRAELEATQNDLARVKATLEFKDEELARKADELSQLNNKVKVCKSLLRSEFDYEFLLFNDTYGAFHYTV